MFPKLKATIRKKVMPDKEGVLSARLDSKSLEDFTDTMDEVKGLLVERIEEVEAVTMCLLTRGHLMLKGKHGTGKSQLADMIFNRIRNANCFKAFFMKNTQPDQIFGPLDSKKYREESIWRHNTKGMLPSAHFFFGDEIYRASDQLLPATLNILNEREFINGDIRENCPLMTAIGTTNFITDSDELSAFHDRWHVTVEVNPIRDNPSVVQMFQGFMAPPLEKPTTFTLEQLVSLQQSVREVKIEEDLLQLYAELLHNFAKGNGNQYISDRRKCAGLRFLQASAILNDRFEVEADDLAAARYIAITVRDTALENSWATAYSTTIGTYQTLQGEKKDLKLWEKQVERLTRSFDLKMSKQAANELHEQVRNALGALANQPQARMPVTPQGKERRATVQRKLDELAASVSDLLR